MEPKSERIPDNERIKVYAGWTFMQFAYAAAYMKRRVTKMAEPTMAGLDHVQLFWHGNVADGLPPRGVVMCTKDSYEWAWTCAAFADAAEFCKRMGLYRVEGKPPPT